jgi:putative FmdB family regulatory protein
MPTYDYECASCKHAFELFQSITAAPITECPECKKPEVKRLIGTGGGLIFKGSGFYCTDYKSKSYKQDASVDRAKKASKEVKASEGGAASTSSSTPKASGTT